MPELHLPWLELAVVIPLLGSVWIGWQRDRERAWKRCLIVCGLAFVCAAGEWWDFVGLKTFEAHDHWDFLSQVFHTDVFVVDELSAPLLPLAALLYMMLVLSTQRTKRQRVSFGWELFSESVLLATLSCRGGWPLVGLLVLGVLPPWIELHSRGLGTRVFSAHMGLFVLLLLLGWSLVSEQALTSVEPLSVTTMLAGALLAAASLLRAGIAPLHCWLPDLFDKATFSTALLFVAPMPGAYAVMRLVLPIAPAWGLQSIAILSLLTAVYAAGMALVQTDARRFFCYLFLSHSSLVLVGLELVTPIGLTGALCVWISVGLSLGGFGMTLRSVESRLDRISLSNYHGLAEHMPGLSGLFLLTGLASIGFPGTIGFIGTELLIEGAVDVYPLVGLAVVVAAALNGIAVMHAYFRIFTGTRHVASISLRARLSERIAVIVMTTLIVGGGIYPQPGIESRYHAAMRVVQTRRTHRLQPVETEKLETTQLGEPAAESMPPQDE